ncbi:MAG: M36 family metallopeptidase [Anaeromyxobacter sp.]|nr:M36 family metallopeptidase [Anaeromyxobacter sp.]
MSSIMTRQAPSALLLALLLAACGPPQSPPLAAPLAAPPSAPPAATPAQPRAPAAAGSPAGRPGNFNALALAAAGGGAPSSGAAVPRPAARAVGHMNQQLGVPSFLWGGPAGAPVARAGGVAPRGGPVEAARAHLVGLAPAYGLTAADVVGAEAARVHDTGRGPVVVTFRQAPGGVEVFRGEASVAMRRDLSLVAVSGSLAPTSALAAASARAAAPARAGRGAAGWTLDAPSALAAALTDLTGQAFAAADFAPAGRAGAFETFDLRPAAAVARAGRFLRPAGVRRTWFRLPGGLTPAWRVEVAYQRLGARETLSYGSVVAAGDGALLFRKDQQEHQAFSYRVWASDPATLLPDDGPQGLAGTPHPTGLLDGYQPPLAAQRLVTLQSLPFSRNDPWLPAGAVETSGNNADAYADLSAPDGFTSLVESSASLDQRAAVTAPGAFDHAYDLAQDPLASASQIQAAVTQLFYDVNALHDWFYDAGFDEAAGNAQALNFGRGGVEGDPLKVEAQDSSGTDNANMSTPADGFSPRMQMFLWSNSDLVKATVNAPAAQAGLKQAAPASFGPQAFELTGDLVPSQPADACAALANAATGPGQIALIDRGTCTFVEKVKAAQAAGYAGVLVRNVLATAAFLPMGGLDEAITIPALMVRKAVGDAIGEALGAGAVVNVTLQRIPGLRRDGTIDNLIVAHEWGHYLSNRLVQDAAGLDTVQARGMGEGWSDFVALLQAVRQEDALAAANAGWAGAYAASGWVATGLDATGAPNQGAYYGIRRTTYSTDLTRSPLTFRHVADGEALPVATPPLRFTGAPNSEVHNAGEVWASALWECYAALLRDTQGAAPRLSYAEASLRMREYLVAAFKLLPGSPTFLEGRDALLAAALAGDPVDAQRFWAAFATRGFGVGASGPTDRFGATNQGVVESFALGGELSLAGPPTLAVSPACDDGDATLDDGETATLTLRLVNTGSGDLPAGAATLTSSTPHLTFPDGGAVAVGPAVVGGEAIATARVSAGGATTAELAEVTLTFAGGYLARPTALSFQLRLDADVLAAASATDTLEAERFAWTPGADPALATDALFQRRTLSAVDHAIFGPDPDTTADITLTSPPLLVGTGPFTLGWRHTFWFEADPAGTPDRVFYDGGVVELSDDGGATWLDVGGPAYNGAISVTGFSNPLEGRPAFVDASPDHLTPGALVPVALDLARACSGGASCAGKSVLLRFRIGADLGFGVPDGWTIDDVAVGGLTNTPFDRLAPDAGRCVVPPPAAPASGGGCSSGGAAPGPLAWLVLGLLLLRPARRPSPSMAGAGSGRALRASRVPRHP